jgi:pimeloyl-ACP methyl ester carboxylesterase
MQATGPGYVARGFVPEGDFDDFHVVRPLGRGAMGTVYLGHDTLLDRPVALKFIDAERIDEASVARFLVEARALARLSHPNVVAVHRFGTVAGRPYLAYEFVAGRSLDQLALPLSAREVLRVGVGVARGLAAAHARGVIHRDLKPANVMRAEGGEIKLLDFGVAKLVETSTPTQRAGSLGPALPTAAQLAAEATTSGTASAGSTRESTLVGTPAYLAPEVWAGEAATPRTDVYGLGALLYLLAVGRLPDAWHTGEATALRAAVMRGLPSLLQAGAASVSPALAAIVDRCTRPDPAARYASAEEVRDALEGLLARETPGATERLRGERALRDDEAPPTTRYAMAGKVSIAYQAIGDGPIDLVLTPGFVSNVEIAWEEPSNARFLRALARHARMITFDKRGTGLSDRVSGPATLEERVDDIRAVMDANASERAAILGVSDGGAMSIAFAAMFPERTRALILYGTTARSRPAPDYDGGLTDEMWTWALDEVTRTWGEASFLEIEAPSMVNDEPFRRWWTRYLRQSASPGAARALLDLNSRLDTRALLPYVRVPTLVIHRRGDPLMPLAGAEYVAAHVPHAELVVLEGNDHIPFVGDADAVVRAIDDFLGRADAARAPTHALVSAIGLIPVGELGDTARNALEPLVRRELARFRGTALEPRIAGAWVAAFDGPIRAVRCARAIVAGARELGLSLRGSVHAGDDDVIGGGARVGDAALRLACAAAGGEIVVSNTSAELLTGSDLVLAPRALRAPEGPLSVLVD